jgi:SAM-dependent methyltransferase
MTLADEYRRQSAWRSWKTVFDALPEVSGRTVLDLGCAIGDQAAELAARGAEVLGFDMDEALLAEARARRIPRATFAASDLRHAHVPSTPADGLWCSFTAAYFPDLTSLLRAWRDGVRRGGWIALTEVDDLFAHEPLSARSRVLLERYAAEALVAGRYDFRMGRRLAQHAERAGFQITRAFTVPDAELAFDGPALAAVVAAWRLRFERMPLLIEMCGAEYDSLVEEFLATLASPDHRCAARVCCVLGRR